MNWKELPESVEIYAKELKERMEEKFQVKVMERRTDMKMDDHTLTMSNSISFYVNFGQVNKLMCEMLYQKGHISFPEYEKVFELSIRHFSRRLVKIKDFKSLSDKDFRERSIEKVLKRFIEMSRERIEEAISDYRKAQDFYEIFNRSMGEENGD